jgi:hypothetical protein
MRSAADTAEQRELDRDMQEAADRAEQNQLRNAMSRQQAAAETLQKMLEQIEESKRAQTEQLLRRLASLIESIERLVAVQENELAALAAAVANEDLTGRDRAMIRLNQNTQAVAVEARAAGQQARRIARTLDRAGDAQGAAVAALRAQPPAPEDSRVAEERSLELLKEALELAKQLEEQTQEEQTKRRREELIEAYRGFAEQQVGIRERTLELAGEGELDRRQLVEARRLGADEDRLRNGLRDLQVATAELMDAPMFSLVHRKIDGWAQRAADGLREGEVGVDVTDPQGWTAQAIGRLIEALEEAQVPPDEFAGQDAGGGGSGGSGQDRLIPPVAELKLLQGMQQEVYDQTRDLDTREDLDEGRVRQRLRDVGQDQRELLDLGQEMLEKMQESGGGPGGPAGPDGP